MLKTKNEMEIMWGLLQNGLGQIKDLSKKKMHSIQDCDETTETMQAFHNSASHLLLALQKHKSEAPDIEHDLSNLIGEVDQYIICIKIARFELTKK